MLCPDKVETARQMERWGVDVIIVHTGLDEQKLYETIHAFVRRVKEG